MGTLANSEEPDEMQQKATLHHDVEFVTVYRRILQVH